MLRKQPHLSGVVETIISIFHYVNTERFNKEVPLQNLRQIEEIMNISVVHSATPSNQSFPGDQLKG